MTKARLGFIGAGNMAEAIARGILSAKVYPLRALLASDISPKRRSFFIRKLGIRSVDSNAFVARNSQTVILSVKPQDMGEVLSEVGPLFTEKHLIISIAAGVGTAFVESFVKTEVPVVRTMPNAPILVGAGITCISPGTWARGEHLNRVRKMLEPFSRVLEVEESLLHSVTALSGSGPAYFFYLVEALAEAGVGVGLSKEVAMELARHTAYGAGKMLLELADAASGPAELRRKVTSPGGTTEAALSVMEGKKWKKIVAQAVRAAASRSRELGK